MFSDTILAEVLGFQDFTIVPFNIMIFNHLRGKLEFSFWASGARCFRATIPEL